MGNTQETAGTPGIDSTRTINIDTEHFKIRFLLPVLTFGLLLLVHFGGQWLLRQTFDGLNWLCIVLPLDVAVLFAGSAMIERGLKLLMPSKRSAVLAPDGLTVQDARQNPPDVTHITWDNPVTLRAWRFEVRRRGSRVPRGWYCMALQVLQDEDDAIIYAFLPQKETEDLPEYDEFVRLRPRKETESNTDLNAVAQQRRLLKLEDRRWEDGAEISRDDFRALLQALAHHVPAWGSR